MLSLDLYALERGKRKIMKQCLATPSSQFCWHHKISACITIKGPGSRNRKQTSYLYDLYCCPRVAIVFRSDFGGWGESKIKLLLKMHQYLCNPTTYECLFISLENSRVHLQNNTYILRKVGKISVIWTINNPENHRFERSLFTLRDPAPLSYICS